MSNADPAAAGSGPAADPKKAFGKTALARPRLFPNLPETGEFLISPWNS
jgi:hypothetical protein